MPPPEAQRVLSLMEVSPVDPSVVEGTYEIEAQHYPIDEIHRVLREHVFGKQVSPGIIGPHCKALIDSQGKLTEFPFPTAKDSPLITAILATEIPAIPSDPLVAKGVGSVGDILRSLLTSDNSAITQKITEGIVTPEVLEQLQKMFLDKNVKITDTHGESSSSKTGLCKSIENEQDGQLSIIIKPSFGYTFLPTEIGADFVSCNLRYMMSEGTRTIELADTETPSLDDHFSQEELLLLHEIYRTQLLAELPAKGVPERNLHTQEMSSLVEETLKKFPNAPEEGTKKMHAVAKKFDEKVAEGVNLKALLREWFFPQLAKERV